MNDDEIQQVCDEIVKAYEPKKIILFNKKLSPTGSASAFKLCIIAEIGDSGAAEKDIYINIDCPIPFDVLIYTPEQWEKYCADKDSFAWRILKTGVVMYE